MSLITNFFIWLEKRQIGILTTIAVHLLIVSAFLIVKLRANVVQEYGIIIDPSQMRFDMVELSPEEIQEQEATVTQELMQTIRQEMRNIPVNVIEQRAQENVERMRQQILAEENISDPVRVQDTAVETANADDVLPDNVYDERFPLDASGGRTVYRGPTTVSYELSGRRHTSMPRPVYRCQTGGTIVVDIVVNNNGYVVTATVNSGRSNSNDACLVNEAVRYAERSRFNQSTLARQNGTIAYMFQTQ